MSARKATLCFLALAAFGLAASAQNAPEGPATASANIAPTAAEIPVRADTDSRFARQAVADAAAFPDPLESLGLQLERISTKVDEMREQFGPEALRQIPAIRLESLAQHWRFEARRLRHWQEDMQRSTGIHMQNAVELARRRSGWEAMLASPEAGTFPAALTGRVEDIVDELRRAEEVIAGQLTRQLALRQRANDIDTRIRTGESAVSVGIDDIDRRLLRIDVPPLWAGSPDRDGQDTMSAFLTGLDIEGEFSAEYSRYSGINRRAYLLLHVVLLPMLLWLSWRHRRSRQAPGQEDPALDRVFSRPFSCWLLLTAIGSAAIQRDAPLMVQQVAMLIALVPVLRLLPPSAHQLLGWWPHMISALYLLENLAFLAMFNTTVYRIYQLALTGIALTVTLWQLRESRERHANRIERAIRVVAWISTGLLAIAALANVVGNVTLAEMLTSGIIDCGYFGLLLYVGFTVAAALIRSLLRHPVAGRDTAPQAANPRLATHLARALVLAGAIGWVVYAMHAFRILRPTYTQARELLAHEVGYGNLSISLGHVLTFMAWIAAAFWVARIVQLFLRDDVLVRLSLPRGVGNSIASLSYYGLIIVGFLLALSAAGFELDQLALIIGALGVGIGFGLQNVVNNFVSGLILMFERPIQPGDIIEFSGTSGRVRNIGMRATTIATFDGADVVVPNGSLISGSVMNWTLLDRNRRIEVAVSVAYGSDPQEVLEILKKTARETPGIAATPSPTALFTGLGSSSQDFVVRAWVSDFDQWVSIRSALVTAILAALRDARISIPFPQQDVHVRSIPEQVGAALPAQSLGNAAAPPT